MPQPIELHPEEAGVAGRLEGRGSIIAQSISWFETPQARLLTMRRR
ncbi:MAG: hypothetical protein AB1342_03660 [Pseudomonadota bacterium]